MLRINHYRLTVGKIEGSNHQFDERGRLFQQTLQLHQTLRKPIERRYDYNVVGELTQITDNYKGIKTFTYDLKTG